MKRLISILSILLTLMVLLAACAAEPEPTAPPTTEPIVAPTTEPTAPPTTEPPTELPTEPSTEQTEPAIRWIQDRDSFEDVVVYPYAPEELQAAMDVAMSILEGYKEKEYVLDFQVRWIAFDPVGTDQYLQMYAPKPTWEGDDHYALWIRFVIEFTVSYDHTLSPNPDREHYLGYIMLTRDTADGDWVLDQGMCSDAVPGTPASTVTMPVEDVAALELTDAPVLAAYRLVVDPEDNPYLADQNLDPQNVYVLYVWDEETQTVRCESHPIAEQPTEPDEELTDVEKFQHLLEFSNGNEQNGYNAALNSEFENPQELDLNLYFWTHFVPEDDWEDFTAEEEAFLIAQGLNREQDAQKRSAEMLDAVLQEYFGLPLSAFQIPDNWVYYEETGCYYTTGTGPLTVHTLRVTAVEHGEDGIVKITYLFDPQYEFMGTYLLTLQEKQAEGETGYYILSHLRIE